ncbi:MAG: hypothetical protein AB1626_05190, partial [Candidatus Micrarchaeota archaeon]
MKTAKLAKFTIVFFVLVLFASASAQAAAAFSICYDLKVLNSAGVAQTSFRQGDAVTLRTRVSNFGSTAAYATVYHELWLGGLAGTKKYGPVSKTISVNSMSDAYSSTPVTLSPSSFPAGTYTYKARIASGCVPTSTCACEKTTTFTVTAASPAFSLTSIRTQDSRGSAKDRFVKGETVYMKATVQNTGTGSGTTTITYQIRRGGSSGTIVCNAADSASPSPGSSSSKTKSCATSSSWATGSYTYEAVISPCSGTCTRTTSFTLEAPAPLFTVDNAVLADSTCITSKTSFPPGDRMCMRGSVRNVGTAAGTANYTFLLTNSSGATVYTIWYTASIAAGGTG